MNLLTLVGFFFGISHAAQFTYYYDESCTIPITTSIAFQDICTWSSNRYSGSWALTLNTCDANGVTISIYNASNAPTCEGVIYDSITVNGACQKQGAGYVKGTDFTCNSQNTTYNIIAHTISDCSDGGIPFSVQLGVSSCQAESFAPGFFDWDTEGSYTYPYYQMMVYNSTDGTCQNTITQYSTTEFPAKCLKPSGSVTELFLDIYEAFPTHLSGF